MTAHYSFDRESFQKFLADAFAVQHSGLDRQFLSALIGMQQFLRSQEFDLSRAMQMIVERTLTVSAASGVAIALLQGNELVYRAASGTAVNDVGRHVPAVLSVSCRDEVRREILRVENAQTDSRVQADVCRQFGAKALLMLPIYGHDALIGTLQVLFSEAHSFLDPEVRMYRLILGLVEEAIGNQVQHATQKTSGGTSLRTITRQGADSRHTLSFENAVIASPLAAKATQQSLSARRSSTNGYGQHFRQFRSFWIRIKTQIQNGVNRRWSRTLWQIGAALTGAMLVVTYNWAPYRYDPPRLALHRNVSTSNDTGQHAVVKPFSGNEDAMRMSDRRRQAARPLAGFKRIRIGPKEVDYVAGDVTIRRFTTGSARPLTRTREKEIDFGDDVTMRYFAHTPSARAQSSPASQGKEITTPLLPIPQ
jgi:hypothetical protein